MKLTKLNSFLICITVVVTSFIGCSNQSKNIELEKSKKGGLSIHQVAYNSLNSRDKDDLVDEKAKGVVEKVIVKKNMGVLTDEKYYGKEVYAVIFHSKTVQLGDITVYVDGKSKKVIGRGYRE